MWCVCWSQGEFSASATSPAGVNCSSRMVPMSGSAINWFGFRLIIFFYFGGNLNYLDWIKLSAHLSREEKFTNIEEMFRRTQMPALKEIGFRCPLTLSCASFVSTSFNIFCIHFLVKDKNDKSQVKFGQLKFNEDLYFKINSTNLLMFREEKLAGCCCR